MLSTLLSRFSTGDEGTRHDRAVSSTTSTTGIAGGGTGEAHLSGNTTNTNSNNMMQVAVDGGGGGGVTTGGGLFPKLRQSDYNLADMVVRKRPAFGILAILTSAPFWACVMYSVASVLMIILNKLVLATYKFDFPMVLLLHQNLTTVISLWLARHFELLTFEELDRPRVIRWIPVDVFFVAMLLTGAYSVQLLSVPMVTIFKNTNNLFVAFGDALIYGNVPSRGVVSTLLLMLLAAVMAGLNDLEFSLRGYVWTFANCGASTAFVLYTRSAIANTNLSTFGKTYYNNVLAMPLVIVADILVFHDFSRLFNADRELIFTFLSIEFFFIWMMSGFIAFALSAVSLRAQKLTSPTTYSMVGALNKIPLTFLGIIIFNSELTRKGAMYVSLSIISGALYSWTKANEEIAKRASAASEVSVEGGGGGVGVGGAGEGGTASPSKIEETSMFASMWNFVTKRIGNKANNPKGNNGNGDGGGATNVVASSQDSDMEMVNTDGRNPQRRHGKGRAKSLPSAPVDLLAISSSL